MTVQVVAVGGVDVVAKPDPRVGERDLGRRHVAGEQLERDAVDLAALLEPERRRTFERALLEPRLDQAMVVVARDHDHLGVADRLADRGQHRAGALQGLRHRPVAELDDVAEQHEPVDVCELGEEEVAHVGTAQQVDLAARAEMEVGDDRGAHRRILSRAAAATAHTLGAMPAPAGERPGGGGPLPRLIGAGARGARAIAGATGLDDAAERTTEEAIVRAIESPAVARALARALETEAAAEVIERAITSAAVERAMSSPEVEAALIRALDSQTVDRVWDHLLASDEVQRLVERIAEAPEIRAAIASQGFGLVEDIGRQIRSITLRLDDVFDRVIRGLTGRKRRAGSTDRVGFVTRLLAALVDAGILNVIFLAVSALIGVAVSGLTDSDGDGVSAPLLAFGLTAWIFFGSIYLVTFWSLVGQTPGMRFLGIRLDVDGERRVGARRAWRRLWGTVLSVLTFGLGFLILARDDRRRSLADRIAGTEVVKADRVAPYSVRASEPEAAPAVH